MPHNTVVSYHDIQLMFFRNIKIEEILLMPKGEKIYRMLKKLKLMN